MTGSLSLDERRERLREALQLARRHAAADQAPQGIGALLQELSGDIDELAHGAGRDDPAAHDRVEQRIEELLAEIRSGDRE